MSAIDMRTMSGVLMTVKSWLASKNSLTPAPNDSKSGSDDELFGIEASVRDCVATLARSQRLDIVSRLPNTIERMPSTLRAVLDGRTGGSGPNGATGTAYGSYVLPASPPVAPMMGIVA